MLKWWETIRFDAQGGSGAGGGAGGQGQGAGGAAGQGQGGQGGSGPGGQGQGAGDQGNQDGQGQTFENWLAGQPDQVKTLLDGHVKGLKSALESERDARKGLEKQLRDLAAKVEKGSEAEKSLTGMADRVAEGDRRVDFYEEAHAAGVTNLKLAYTVAVQDEMFDRKGRVNFEEMKKQYPELFGGRPAAAKGNAGAGTQGGQGTKGGMNEFIRRSAGRG